MAYIPAPDDEEMLKIFRSLRERTRCEDSTVGYKLLEYQFVGILELSHTGKGPLAGAAPYDRFRIGLVYRRGVFNAYVRMIYPGFDINKDLWDMWYRGDESADVFHKLMSYKYYNEKQTELTVIRKPTEEWLEFIHMSRFTFKLKEGDTEGDKSE